MVRILLISFTRTIILYSLVVVALRIMGKRQIGELQPSELVVAIMISDLATVPMGDTGIPLLYGIVPILTLVCAEILLSFLCLKSQRLRVIVSGKPAFIIERGKINQQEMKKSRYSLSDLLEELRMMDVFDISSVYTAILETNGQISVMTRENASNRAYVLVSDGKIQQFTLNSSPFNKKDLYKFVGSRNIKDIFVLSVSAKGNVYCVMKEKIS